MAIYNWISSIYNWTLMVQYNEEVTKKRASVKTIDPVKD